MPDNRCKNCKYHADEGRIVYGEGVCDNPGSNYFEYYTDNNAHCKAFEQREEGNG